MNRMVSIDAAVKAVDKYSFDTSDGTCLCEDITCILEEVESEQDLCMTEYQNLAARTIDSALSSFHQEEHALHGMVAEVGELHGIYQKIFQGHSPDPEHMKKELGDLLWFMAEYCTAKKWNLADIAQLNIDKLRARYPDGFDAEHSLHRQKDDI